MKSGINPARRMIAAALAALFTSMFVLTGCVRQSSHAGTAADGKLSVVVTIFPSYDFVRAIAGDKADIALLLSPGAESHSYDPTPQDMIKIQNCDVFIYVGGESDEWVTGILESMYTSKIKIVTLMDCVEVVGEEIVEGMQEEEHGDGEPAYDEHVWTSPGNAKLIVQKISDTLCEADAPNSAIYKQNTTSYLEKLDELDAQFRAVVDSAARKTVVFGDRFPFRYFVDAYGLTYFAAFPGCAAETEVSAKTVAFLIDKLKAEEIPVVFHIELSNENIANTISSATGAKVLLFHSCHNISKADFEAGKTYIDIMTANVDALREALS